MATNDPATPRVAYQQDGVQYVDKIIRLFGGYKKRSFAFLDVQPGQRILDVGCGAGDDCRALAQLAGPAGRVVGLDSSPDMIRAARQRAQRSPLPVEFMEGDVYRLPFDEASFDRARADRLFQHLDQPARALDEMIRVVAPGGWISVLDVDWATLVVDAEDGELTRRILGYQFAQQVNGAAGRQAYGLLKRAGLEQVEAYSEAVCMTEFGIAKFIWGLDVFARRAAEAGVVSNADAERWVRDLEQRDAGGVFFASMTGFCARGRKS